MAQVYLLLHQTVFIDSDLSITFIMIKPINKKDLSIHPQYLFFNKVHIYTLVSYVLLLTVYKI